MSIYYDIEGIEDIIADVLDTGVWIKDPRTGVNTKAIFDAKLIIEKGFPFNTNHMSSPRLAFEELWFFLNGKTNTKELEAKGVNFWKGNTSKEFHNKVGLNHLAEGNLGVAYSKQWRDFGGYISNYGKDQLAELVSNLGTDKYSRRHYVTLWNPAENEYGVLTPCWHSCQFVVLPDHQGYDVLHLKLINRSLDILFGARFAIMQYRLLQMALCKMFDFRLGELSCDLSHIHLYENQIEYAEELISREYMGLDESDVENSIELKADINSLDDLLSLQWDDFEVEYTTNKEPFKTPRPEMVA